MPVDPKLPGDKPLTQENLQWWYERLAPRGSGPLSMMKLCCQFIEVIAHLKGWTLTSP